MRRDEAAQMMRALMDEYGLTPRGWTFGWMNRRRTLGLCRHGRLELQLSTHFVDANERDVVDQVCRHEVAHALAGHQAGHGEYWKAVARMCGVRNPASTCNEDDLVMKPGRYQTTCTRCDRVYSMHRRPTQTSRSRYCRPCAQALGNWTLAVLPPFEDAHALVAEKVSAERVSAPLSARQSTLDVSPPASDESAPQTFSAPQVAAAMGVDGKKFRAWLRKWAIGKNFQQGPKGAYAFTEADVREIVRAWNETH